MLWLLVYGAIPTWGLYQFILKMEVKMKKIMRFILVAIFVCSFLVGCASTDSGSEVTDLRYSPGTRTKTDYTSEWLGLKYTLNANMVMTTVDELNAMRSTEDAITATYDMVGINVIDGSNIIITAEKLLVSGVTEEQYLASIKNKAEQMDMIITFNDLAARMISGIEFLELSHVREVNGVVLNQMLLIKKVNDRMAAINLTYFDQATLDELLAGFSAY